jgi:hypothetical protein
MGRTNPTYRDFLDAFERRWRPFRRALRQRYERDFDAVFAKARRHADAAGYADAADPELAVVVSVLLARETELRRLRERVDVLENQCGNRERDDDRDGDPTGCGVGEGGGRERDESADDRHADGDAGDGGGAA